MNGTDLVNGDYFTHYVDKLTELPLCIDIALEMLSGDDMMRATALQSNPTEQDKFVSRNSKLYSTRVYFQNRVGYQAR